MNTQKLLEENLKEFNPKKDVKRIGNFFLKIGGKDRKEYIENEIKALEKLKTISSFYKNYFIDTKTYKGNIAILLKFIQCSDLSFLFKCNFIVEILLQLYKSLLLIIKVYHDNNLIHGDIKPENFIFFINKKTKKPRKR